MKRLAGKNGRREKGKEIAIEIFLSKVIFFFLFLFLAETFVVANRKLKHLGFEEITLQ